jgi:hypothetical protein
MLQYQKILMLQYQNAANTDAANTDACIPCKAQGVVRDASGVVRLQRTLEAAGVEFIATDTRMGPVSWVEW